MTGTGVVARRHGRVHAELCHYAAARVPGVEVAADPEMLNLDLLRPAALGGPHQLVNRRLVEVIDVGHIRPEFAGDVLRIEHRLFLPAVAVQPCEIREREGRGLLSRAVSGLRRRRCSVQQS